MGPNFSAYIRNVGRDPFIDGEPAGPGPSAGSPNWPQQQQPSAPAAQRSVGVRPPNPNYVPPMDTPTYNSAHRGRTIPVPQGPTDEQLQGAYNRLTGPVKPLPAPRITNTPGVGFQRVGPQGPQLRQAPLRITNTPGDGFQDVRSEPSLIRNMRDNPNQVFGPVRDAMLRESAQGVETTTARPATPSTATPQRTPGVQRTQPQRRRPSIHGGPSPNGVPTREPRVVAPIPPNTGLNTMPRQWDPNSVTPSANAVDPLTTQLRNAQTMDEVNRVRQNQIVEGMPLPPDNGEGWVYNPTPDNPVDEDVQAPRRGRRTGAPSTRRRGRN